MNQYTFLKASLPASAPPPPPPVHNEAQTKMQLDKHHRKNKSDPGIILHDCYIYLFILFLPSRHFLQRGQPRRRSPASPRSRGGARRLTWSRLAAFHCSRSAPQKGNICVIIPHSPPRRPTSIMQVRPSLMERGGARVRLACCFGVVCAQKVLFFFFVFLYLLLPLLFGKKKKKRVFI